MGESPSKAIRELIKTIHALSDIDSSTDLILFPLFLNDEHAEGGAIIVMPSFSRPVGELFRIKDDLIDDPSARSKFRDSFLSLFKPFIEGIGGVSVVRANDFEGIKIIRI